MKLALLILAALPLMACNGSFAWEDPINEQNREDYWKHRIVDLKAAQLNATSQAQKDLINQQLIQAQQEL